VPAGPHVRRPVHPYHLNCRCLLDHMFDDQFSVRRSFLEQPEALKQREWLGFQRMQHARPPPPLASWSPFFADDGGMHMQGVRPAPAACLASLLMLLHLSQRGRCSHTHTLPRSSLAGFRTAALINAALSPFLLLFLLLYFFMRNAEHFYHHPGTCGWCCSPPA